MISVKCPHCHVGLKVDEGKIPLDISSFKCPRCKGLIPVSLLHELQSNKDEEQDTVVIRQTKSLCGKLTVLPNSETPEQHFQLHEGVYTVGRESPSSKADIAIKTSDRSMSRAHIRIEVKGNPEKGYKHYLSDNHSKNHTMCNNNSLGEGEIVILRDGDEIVIGHTIIRFNE